MNEDTRQPEMPASGSQHVPGRLPHVVSQNAELIGTPVLAEPPAPPGSGLAAYLNAFRRRWFAATSIGLLIAAIAGATVWFVQQPKYTATAALHVASSEERLVFSTRDGPVQSPFDMYKRTRQQLVKDRYVLTAALRQPKVAELDVVREQVDPVKWLQDEIRVDFPGNSEIMQISLTGSEPGPLATLVNAVVDAFQNEVVDDETRRQDGRLGELDDLYRKKQSEVREKRKNLKELAEQLGTGDADTLSTRQQIAMQLLGLYRQELVRTEADLRRLNTEVAIKEGRLRLWESVNATGTSVDALAQTGPNAQSPEAELDVEAEVDALVDTLAQTDPEAQRLHAELTRIQAELAEAEEKVKAEYLPEETQRYKADLATTRKQLDKRREQLRGQLRGELKRRKLGEVQQLKSEVAILKEQAEQIKKDLEDQRKEVVGVGGSSIEIEMMRAELGRLEDVLDSIAEQRERLRIEVDRPPRITVRSRAVVPTVADSNNRIALTLLAVIVGFCVPVGGITLGEVRARRISSSADVTDVLGIRVLGVAPQMYAGIAGGLKRSSKKAERWRGLVRNSMDMLAATLLRKLETEQARVILVSSSVSGEGKTTLATQVATSLARIGRRTLLVDFDLRRPALHEVFGVASEPGISEVLRGRNRLAEVVQSVGDHLSLVTAGRRDRQTWETLANGNVQSLFVRFRREHDFVIIDSSPLLSVAESRLVAQHVDAVLLSLLRDVSRASLVMEACEALEDLEVRCLGAVVAGSPRDVYYDRYAYEAPV
jgi:capsular exopolysaccharide synthesis family protein